MALLAASQQLPTLFGLTAALQQGVTVNQARARVRDKSPVAQPAVNVQIAVYSGGVCGAYTAAKKDDTSTTGMAQAYGINTPDNNLIFSDWTATVAIACRWWSILRKNIENRSTTKILARVVRQ